MKKEFELSSSRLLWFNANALFSVVGSTDMEVNGCRKKNTQKKKRNEGKKNVGKSFFFISVLYDKITRQKETDLLQDEFETTIMAVSIILSQYNRNSGRG